MVIVLKSNLTPTERVALSYYKNKPTNSGNLSYLACREYLIAKGVIFYSPYLD